MVASESSATDWHRTCFSGAARSFVALVRQVPSDAWDRPALGTWNVRGLVGHASRAFTVLPTYLAAAEPGARPPGETAVELDGPVAYYLAALDDRLDAAERERADTAIAERGREAGVALGPDPAHVVAELALDTLDLLDRTPDDALLECPVGTMTLLGYLPTRTFELTVHSLDLAAALALATPAVLGPAVTYCCELAGQLAGQRACAPDLLLLMTGRSDGSGRPSRGLSVL